MTRGSDQPPKPADPQREFDAVWGELLPEADPAAAPAPANTEPAAAPPQAAETKVWDDAARAEPLRRAAAEPAAEHAADDEGFVVERSGKFLRTASEEMALLMTERADGSSAEDHGDGRDDHGESGAAPQHVDAPDDGIERHEVPSAASVAARERSRTVSSAAGDDARGEVTSAGAEEAEPPKPRPRVAVTPSSRPRPISSPVRVPLEPIGSLGRERRGIGMLPIVLVLSLATGAWLLLRNREREPKPIRTAESHKVAQPAAREGGGGPAREPRESRETREGRDGPQSPARPAMEPNSAEQTPAVEPPAPPPSEPVPAPTPAPSPAPVEPTAPARTGDPRAAPPGTPPEIAEVFARLPVSPADLPPVGGVGESGIHVDRITTGSSYDKGNCGGSVDRFSVAEHDVVNVCLRVVHPRTREEISVLWQRHGQSTARRGKVAIKDIHAYRTRAYLKLRKEYVGDWTVKIVSQDGVELASHDFSVAE